MAVHLFPVNPEAGDAPAGTGTPYTLAPDESLTGVLKTAYDRDWVAVTLEAGKRYVFDLQGSAADAGRLVDLAFGPEGTLADPYLRLYDSTGTLIEARDGPASVAPNARITYEPTADGTYYLSAEASGGGSGGSYRLSVTELDLVAEGADAARGTATAYTLPVHGVFQGDIDTAGDIDAVAVRLVAGQVYTVDLQGAASGVGTLGDPYVAIYDGKGNLLAFDDDSGRGKESTLTFVAPDNGLFYIKVQDRGQGTGSYELRVVQGDPSDGLLVQGSSQGDSLWGAVGDDTVLGAGGNDTLFGRLGDDLLYGGSSDDVLYGGWGNDTLYGGSGWDELWGGSGDDVLNNASSITDDTMNGGGGHDSLTGGAGNEMMFGAAGDDMLLGAGGFDTLRGGDGADRLWGGEDADVVSGGAGADILGGGDGDDQLWGGAGDDRFYGGTGDDTLGGDAGVDVIQGGAGDDLVWGGDAGDWLQGDAGADTLYGGTGDDVLIGGTGGDSLYGGDGDDTLWGAGWSNRLEGGAGADVFVFSVGTDRITDFSTTDGDALALDEELWFDDYGTLTEAEVATNFASLSGSDVVLRFDTGATLTIEGLNTLTGLETLISIV